MKRKRIFFGPAKGDRVRLLGKDPFEKIELILLRITLLILFIAGLIKVIRSELGF